MVVTLTSNCFRRSSNPSINYSDWHTLKHRRLSYGLSLSLQSQNVSHFSFDFSCFRSLGCNCSPDRHTSRQSLGRRDLLHSYPRNVSKNQIEFMTLYRGLRMMVRRWGTEGAELNRHSCRGQHRWDLRPGNMSIHHSRVHDGGSGRDVELFNDCYSF